MNIRVILFNKFMNQIKIAIFHGGEEYSLVPNFTTLRHFEEARFLGFQILIGHHPHVPQGIRFASRWLQCFSLGNFVFSSSLGLKHQLFSKGYALQVTVNSSGLIRSTIFPYQIIDGWKIRLLKEDEKSRFLGMIRHLSNMCSSKESITEYWKESTRRGANSPAIPLLAGTMLSAYSDGSVLRLIHGLAIAFFRSLLGILGRRKDRLHIMNILRTSSHREKIERSFMFDD